MDVKYVNPFIKSFCSVMPQLGFASAGVGELSAKKQDVVTSGLVIVLGIIGEVKGNVVYTLDFEGTTKIASTMIGSPVEEVDDLVKSAISELTNMLTAHAATELSNVGISIQISTPTLFYGDNINVHMNSDKILCVRLIADDISLYVNIAFES